MRTALFAVIVTLLASVAEGQVYTGYIDITSHWSVSSAEAYRNAQIWDEHGVVSAMYLPQSGGRATWIVRYPLTSLQNSSCAVAANSAPLPLQVWNYFPAGCSGCLGDFVAETFFTEPEMQAAWNNLRDIQRNTALFKGRTAATNAPWAIVYQHVIEVCP